MGGQSLFKAINELLDSNGLDSLDCRCHNYDGAAAVAGKSKGLAPNVLGINSKALKTHCSGCPLTLAIVASCEEQRIRNLITNIKEIFCFLNLSLPRNNCLKEKILQFCPNSSNISLRMSLERDGWKE